MGLSSERSGASHAARLDRYGAVSTALALLSDRRLGELVDEAPVIGSGIGGTAVLLEIEGTPVFVKRVPLTDLESRSENIMSTANLFQFPTFISTAWGRRRVLGQLAGRTRAACGDRAVVGQCRTV